MKIVDHVLCNIHKGRTVVCYLELYLWIFRVLQALQSTIFNILHTINIGNALILDKIALCTE